MLTFKSLISMKSSVQVYESFLRYENYVDAVAK